MRTLVFLTLLAACGGAPAVDLPAPWDPAEPAVGDGVVETATPEELHVRYDDAPEDLESRWERAYKASGYKVSEPIGIRGIISFKISQGTTHYDLLITRNGRRADVLMTP